LESVFLLEVVVLLLFFFLPGAYLVWNSRKAASLVSSNILVTILL